MPTIFLSPSTQEFNEYVIGGSEEYYMNLLADAMIPYLNASGINYVRNSPSGSAAASIAQSNMGNYDLHLALHSNAAPPQDYGLYKGPDVYYYPTSEKGRRAAEIIANNLKAIYPEPDRVDVRSSTAFGELRRVKAPSVFLELAYHDNVDDANWIANNLDEIAKNLVLSLTEYFGIPFDSGFNPMQGIVSTRGSNLNVRSAPNINAPVIATLPNGSEVTVSGQSGQWYRVSTGSVNGWASSRYILI